MKIVTVQVTQKKVINNLPVCQWIFSRQEITNVENYIWVSMDFASKYFGYLH